MTWRLTWRWTCTRRAPPSSGTNTLPANVPDLICWEPCLGCPQYVVHGSVGETIGGSMHACMQWCLCNLL
jgi:hypothetical protein